MKWALLFRTFCSKEALGALVQRGEVSALELLETAIARAEAINPKINAIVYRGYDQARTAAAAFKPAGEPFAGVPLLLKDLLGDCAGMPTRFASAFVPPIAAPADSYLVARLKRAGFVPFVRPTRPNSACRHLRSPSSTAPRAIRGIRPGHPAAPRAVPRQP